MRMLRHHIAAQHLFIKANSESFVKKLAHPDIGIVELDRGDSFGISPLKRPQSVVRYRRQGQIVP